jgi:hypothetical protein
MPPPPDFSAPTHKRHRKRLAEVVGLAEADDLPGLKAWAFPGFLSSPPRAIHRFRDLAITALEARARGGAR